MKELIKKIKNFIQAIPSLIRRKIKGFFQFKLSGIILPKIKFSRKSFVIFLIIVASMMGLAGISYGAVEYEKISNSIKRADQLVKEEKYSEANEKLKFAQNSWLVKNLGIKKQAVSNEIEKNKKLDEDKLKYNQGLYELDGGNLQMAIDLLSELSENSFYYQRAQTKTEEAKRKIVEEELGETKIAKKEAEESAQRETIKRNQAEAKAKQEKFEKELKEQQLSEKEAEEKRMNTDNDNDSLTYRRELELGTSDWNKDSDEDGIEDSLDNHPSGGGRNQAQTFTWSYGGYSWTWTESIQEDWYSYYKNKSRTSAGSANYITSNDPFIKKIAQKISEGEKPGIPKTWIAVSFVQSLSYVDDRYTGYDEYPKYPIETFFEKNGDCEDTSYLAASIVNAMGIGTVLVLLPGHMAIGVWMDCSTAGTYYKLNDRCYYYVETTGENWSAGKIPDEYRYTSVTLIEVPLGGTFKNISPQYIKPCAPSSDFPGYYSDGSKFYSDSQCNNQVTCLSSTIPGYFWSTMFEKFYHDSSCTQEVVKGCIKATSFPGYFTNGVEYYSDSRCIQKAAICRLSSVYYDRYWDGSSFYWDSGCTQRVVSYCTKSIYYPGNFFNSIDGKIYVDYQCTIEK